MAPLIVAVIVGASLFAGGTAIKPEQPQIGTVLQAAGLGTVAGGVLGSVAGVASAASVSTTTAITGGAVAGGLATPAIYLAVRDSFVK